jgi:hypothetical protein
LEEVLEDDVDYPLFSTKADVDYACDQLQTYYDIIFSKDFDFGMPTTFGLCNVQKQIRHLCPGVCDGGCFDGPTGYPPTCDGYPPDSFMFDPDQINWQVCDDIDYNILYYVGDLEDILNISLHADHLRAIPGNSTECDQARQAYSTCYWCATDRCFNDEFPISCQPPTYLNEDGEVLPKKNLPADELALADSVCSSLFNPLHVSLVEGTPEFYNESLHQDQFYFGASNNSFCDLARLYYHECFFCHQIEYDEHFCFIGEWCKTTTPIPEDYVLEEEFRDLNISISGKSCEQVYDEWDKRWYNPYTLTGCYRDIFLHRQCPEVFCKFQADDVDLNANYLGTSNDSQKRALIWMSRVSAILSFMGASYIMAKIATDPEKRKTVYYELLFSMAFFDVVTAVAWSFATAPIDHTEAGHILGAVGTKSTCTAQAFFVQLGFTSIFYNVSLSIYYILVVVYGWKEFQLKLLQKYLLGIPLLVGLGLALTGLPVYHWIEYGCHLNSLQFSGELWAILTLVVVPLSLSILFISGSMVYVYMNVRQKTRKALQWSLSSQNQERMLQQVFWQCLLYSLAFYITWPILFSVYLGSVEFDGPLGLSLTVAFVMPLQGFTNWLVFIRIPVTNVIRRRYQNMSSAFYSLRMLIARNGENSGGTSEEGVSGNSSFRVDMGNVPKPDESVDPSALMALTSLPFMKNSQGDPLEQDSAKVEEEVQPPSQNENPDADKSNSNSDIDNDHGVDDNSEAEI